MGNLKETFNLQDIVLVTFEKCKIQNVFKILYQISIFKISISKGGGILKGVGILSETMGYESEHIF